MFGKHSFPKCKSEVKQKFGVLSGAVWLPKYMVALRLCCDLFGINFAKIYLIELRRL